MPTKLLLKKCEVCCKLKELNRFRYTERHRHTICSCCENKANKKSGEVQQRTYRKNPLQPFYKLPKQCDICGETKDAYDFKYLGHYQKSTTCLVCEKQLLQESIDKIVQNEELKSRERKKQLEELKSQHRADESQIIENAKQQLKIQSRTKRERNQLYLIATPQVLREIKSTIKLSLCCQLCGYSKCSAGLDFHHVDRKTKIPKVLGCGNLEIIIAEIEKCVVL